MKRYHIKVFFFFNTSEKLKAFTINLNNQDFKYTLHSIDNIKYRFIDLKEVLTFIKTLSLDYKSIFEYYTDDNDKIIKACYRIKYNNGIDLILVLNDNKGIVTIYINTADDSHDTLNKSLYIKA